MRVAISISLCTALLSLSDWGISCAVAADVPQYRVFETQIVNNNSYANKFRNVTLNAVFTSPAGVQTPFWGFYDGDGGGGQSGNVWKLRFMPTVPGMWSYTYTWSDGTPGGSGSFDCVTAGRGKGVIQPYVQNPKWLAYNGTEPVMLNEYYVALCTRLDLGWTITNVYERLRSANVNAVMFLGAPATEKWWDGLEGHRWSDGPAPLLRYPQDYHLDAWKLLEGHVGWLNDRDMLAYLWSGFYDNDDFWVKYCCARLAPFANVAWNYRYETVVPAWLLDAWINYDPWNHLRGGQHHPGWADAPDKYTWLNVSTAWDSPTASVNQRHQDALTHWTAAQTIPLVWNEGPLWHNEYLTDQEHMRRLAWGTITAGGYFVWNWTCSLSFNAGANPENYDPTRPRAASEILASNMDEYVNVLVNVMRNDVEFARLNPADSLLNAPSGNVFCLAEPGRQYLVYREGGGALSLTLAAGTYDTYWVDTKTGNKSAVTRVNGSGAPYGFTAPNTATDWVLIAKSTIRILPLGDSITQANNQNQSYRYPLWKTIVATNLTVDFVGSQNTNYGGNPVWPDFNGKPFDRDHEGHWGWRADEILGGLDGWLAGYTPDLVLLHIGSNDLYQGQDVNSTVDEIKQIIDHLRNKNPNVKVLLAKLIPTTLAFNTGVNRLNAEMDALAASQDTLQSPVLVVDQNTGFDAATETFDGVHPNAAGEEKMAQRWFDAVQALLNEPPLSQAAAPTISPNGGTFLSPVNVTLSSATPGASIRFTTDASTPTAVVGTPYSGAFALNSNATVKAIAYKSGFADSPVVSATFTIGEGLPGAFVKGINLNGPAVTIEGNSWLSDSAARAAGFSTLDSANFSTTYGFPVSPTPTADELSMLQTLVYHGGNGGFTLRQTLTNGNYNVYLWTIENYQPNFRAIDVILEGLPVATNIGRLPLGEWRRHGPYGAAVSDGELTIGINPNSSNDPLLCGLAIFTQGAPATSSLPSPWQSIDIGSPGLAGNASYSTNGEAFTVIGSGADIWSTSDQFQYVHRPISGDCDIRARVTSQQNTDPWAKAGVMIRQSTAANAVHAFMCITPANGFAFQRRVSAGGDTTHTDGGVLNGSPNNWVRLTRSGNTFTSYKSADGLNWTLVGSESITMSGSVQVGLAVTAHNNGTLNSTVFDNVAVAGPVPRFLPPVLDDGQIILNWTGVGQLEWATNIIGPWSSITPAPGPPYSEAVVSAGNRFFRFNVSP